MWNFKMYFILLIADCVGSTFYFILYNNYVVFLNLNILMDYLTVT